MLVGGVVVDDQVKIEMAGNVSIEMTQEREEHLVTTTRLTLGETCPLYTSKAEKSVVVPCRR